MRTRSWISVEQAREAMFAGRGTRVRIAVIDSGVEVDHPDLAGLNLIEDVHVIGDGTAIAGIIYNLAPEVELGSFRVLSASNVSRTQIICEGVNLAIERDYHILNCSFGCGVADHIHHYKSWIDRAYLKGIHIVAACNNEDFTKPEWPGYFPSVITVNYGKVENEEDL